MDADKVDLIEKRVIEACALVPVIKAFGEKIGIDSAKALVQQTHEDMSRNYGKACAKERGKNNIAVLAEIVSGWGKGGALEEEIIEFSETSYAFNVTRCMYAERYQQLGMEEFGYCLSCCRDEPFAKGFNADIRFERNQTIMEGAPHCDFRFTLEHSDRTRMEIYNMNDTHKKPKGAGKSSFELINPKILTDMLPVETGSVVLDLACGKGIYSIFRSSNMFLI